LFILENITFAEDSNTPFFIWHGHGAKRVFTSDVSTSVATWCNYNQPVNTAITTFSCMYKRLG